MMNRSGWCVFWSRPTSRAFWRLLDALGRHQPFETALPRIYPAKFATVATLEEKFREYAAKDFGTTLQQAEE